MSKAIRTEALRKVYKGKKGKQVVALHGLNLEVEAGTTFGFIGPNGAGKTSTIKILTGLGFPSSGHAYLHDVPSSRAAARKAIGFLPEVATYSSFFEAQELLTALGRMQGMAKTECGKKSEELLERVGLRDRSKSRLGEFSKGMLQRFGIAQALLHDPSILILDEPTSGLDPIAQRQVLSVLHDLKGSGITIFFSSHQLVEVEGLCDYVGIVDLGELIFYGTLSELESRETTPFLIRYRQPESAQLHLKTPSLSSRALDGDVREICIERSALDKALSELHESGGTVVAVLPQRFPLEEIFVRMITQHKNGGQAS